MKKSIALLLAIFMIVQMVPAVTLADAAAPLNLVATINENVATVKVVAASDFAVANFSFQLAIPEGCSILTIVKGANYDSVIGGSFLGYKETGVVSCTPDNLESDTAVATGTEIAVFTVDVTNAVSNTLTFDATVNAAADVNGDPLDWQGAAMTSNVVAKPVASANPYEVYYTLENPNGEDTTPDDDNDGYYEYALGEEVTMTLFLKNNTANAMILQAYDVYLSHHAALKFSAVEGPIKAYRSGEAAVADGEVTHIQFVADKENEKTLTSGATLELGKITFTIDSATAVFGEAMDIKLVQALDTDQNETLEKEVTNFSVGTEENGDKKSYYPVVIGELNGAVLDAPSYTVTFLNGDNSPLQTGSVGHGLTAGLPGQAPTKASTAQHSYAFQYWTMDGMDGAEVDPTTYAIREDTTFIPVFTESVNSYVITWVDGDGNETNVELAYGTTPSYVGTPTKSATDLSEYVFTGWSPEIAPVTGPATYTAQFEEKPIEYTITFSLDGGKLVDVSGTTMKYTYVSNTTLPTATKEGYAFGGWELKTETDGWAADTYPAGTSANDKWGDVTLVAVWTAKEYDVTANDAEHGKVVATPDGGKLNDIITVTVTPDPGYELDELTVVNADTNTTITLNKGADGIYTFLMPAANVTVTATFKMSTYGITEVTPENGTVTVDQETANYGDEITLTATPEPGYQLVGYSVYDGDGKPVEGTVNENGTYTFTMPASGVTVTAIFEKMDLNVTLVTDETQGTVEVPETAQVDDEVTVKVEAKPGYEVENVTVTYDDGETRATQTVTVTDNQDGTYTFDMPAYPVTVTVTWNPLSYKVTLNLNEGTLAEDANVTSYEYGTVTKLPGADKVTKEGWVFGGWYTNEACTGDPVTEITATDIGDKVFYARWNPDATIVIEDYTYAADGYVLIRVTDNLDPGREYQFNGVSMFWTDDANYKIDPADQGTFYLLITKNHVEADGSTLTADAGQLLKSEGLEEGGSRAEIEYDGDINGDGVLNIADANIVYQMLENESGADYYQDLDIVQRLKADMDKACEASDTSELHRGSLEDVNWIVNLINGVANPEPAA